MIEKKFEDLVELRQTQRLAIKTCSALLPNKMQCQKGADFQVTETVPPTKEYPTGQRVYQLCRQHAVLEEKDMVKRNEDEKSAVAANPPAPVISGPVISGPPAKPPVGNAVASSPTPKTPAVFPPVVKK